MLAAGRLSRAQLDLRLTLRSAMEGAGFIQLPHEWWHYDALPAAQVRATYRRCE
ncbi:MAG: M15 family metallopeptidase [Bdellovibrionota bacterium]